MRVVEISATDTHDLRRRVLRNDDAAVRLAWPGDDDATTTHLGVVAADGAIVAISTWRRDDGSVQLRGMATEPTLAGTGLGTMLLAGGVERARVGGVDVIWANARTTAVDFYTRHGFDVEGDEFVTPDTGLLHRRVTLRLR